MQAGEYRLSRFYYAALAAGASSCTLVESHTKNRSYLSKMRRKRSARVVTVVRRPSTGDRAGDPRAPPCTGTPRRLAAMPLRTVCQIRLSTKMSTSHSRARTVDTCLVGSHAAHTTRSPKLHAPGAAIAAVPARLLPPPQSTLRGLLRFSAPLGDALGSGSGSGSGSSFSSPSASSSSSPSASSASASASSASASAS